MLLKIFCQYFPPSGFLQLSHGVFQKGHKNEALGKYKIEVEWDIAAEIVFLWCGREWRKGLMYSICYGQEKKKYLNTGEVKTKRRPRDYIMM